MCGALRVPGAEPSRSEAESPPQPVTHCNSSALAATLVAGGLAALLGAAIHQGGTFFTQALHGKG